MTSIDARLLVPGAHFLDPFDHTDGVFVLESINIMPTRPHADDTVVVAVTLYAVRLDDGKTPPWRRAADRLRALVAEVTR